VGAAGGAGVGSGAGVGGVGTGGVGASVASVGTGPGGAGGSSAASSISAQEEAMLRLYLSDYLSDTAPADNVMAGNLSTMQTASLLYRSGHKRAAKELLCERRDVYNAFRRTATPCLARADWELKEANAAIAAPSFRPGAYRTRADCLTAAYTARAPLSSCDGR
jgi:hypothetical protein